MSRRTRKKNRQVARKALIEEKEVTETGNSAAAEAKEVKETKETIVREDEKTKAKELPKGGLIIYGAGDHLKDMLAWHKDLASRIARVVDKNEAKIGQKVYGLDCKVEAPKVLKELPVGTQVAISALRYYGEIVKELHEINAGLVCPDIDQAYSFMCQFEARGMLVYGVGAHLEDMLAWHPDLKGRIARVFDKDQKRWGQKEQGTGRTIESPEVLKRIAPGTKIAISAIRYYEEIAEEIYALNPGLVCLDIDEAYAAMPVIKTPAKPAAAKTVVAKQKPATTVAAPKPVVKVRNEMSVLQKQRLRGKESAERWRRKFLIECANMRKVFWGTKGVRANYLIQEYRPFMGKTDFFIDEDVNLRGHIKAGLPICVPDVLKDIRGRFKIIILSRDYAKISEKLRDYGYIENVDFVEGRQLLGEDENGCIDVPCVDKTREGMIVYAECTHLADMLKAHPELAWAISRVIDKDKKKVGTLVKDVGVSVEPLEVLRDVPVGTEIVVADIENFQAAQKDMHELQPGVICKKIDDVWREYV